HERAQWIAWVHTVGTEEGPVLDLRNLPLLVAAGRSRGVLRDFAGPDAVELSAVTTKTVASLAALVED
ncbi:MAG: hypothetical protein ABI200_04750, partial [Gaiellales bacterium]